MTCFWDGIRTKIPRDDMIKYLANDINSNEQFITAMKNKISRQLVIGVKWNGQSISQQEVAEYAEWIANYDIQKINQGHDCSICDPFLVFISYIFNVDIRHDYCGNTIMYTVPNPRNVLTFASDRGHFW